MATAESPISLNVIEAQAEKLLSQAPVLADLEVFSLFAHQRLQARLGKDYVLGRGRGTWAPVDTANFGQIGVVREPKEKPQSYFQTTLSVNWESDQTWSLKIIQEEKDYHPKLTEVSITSPRGSGRFIPAELAQA